MGALGIEMKLQEDGYMVENSGTYFKIGLKEGRILERVVKGEAKDIVIREEGITENDFEQLFIGLREAGVIGEGVRHKKNILFYKIPLFAADKMFSCVAAFIHRKIDILKKVFLIVNIIAAMGLVLMIKNAGEIFSLSTFKLSIAEYVMLYLAFFLSVCVHEFAHGTVCRYVGGKVGTVGFIFIFFSPAMYCDISGIRMVEDRRKQIAASAAGVYVNIIGMSYAAILYAITKEPIFALYSILSLTTIVSNLVPVIRLDGYWILSFATGITNLYNKSLKSVDKLFKRCSTRERFIAIYGIVTYICMIMAIGSLGLTIINTAKYLISIII